MSAFVSIIIPNYNGSELILRCLDSVVSQEGICEVEIIVIDDGSTDDSRDIVHSFPHQVILIQQENMGPAVSRNKGIELAKGKYLAFLDADDYWTSGFLDSTVKFLEDNPEVIAVSVGQIHKIPNKPDSIVPIVLKNNPGKYSQPLVVDNFFEFWSEHNHVCTGSVLMRTDIVKMTGGQRPELRITEDLEFWAYLATFGKWGFIPDVLFVSDGGILTKKTGWMGKNRKRWSSAPTVENWEKRIFTRLKEPLPPGYAGVRGRIAGNLAYSMILSSRSRLARETIKEFKENIPNNSITSLMKVGSEFKPLWYIICLLIRTREFVRCV